MLKHILITLLMIPVALAATHQADLFEDRSAIEAALDKATEELKHLKVDAEYLTKHKTYWEFHLTDIIAGNYVHYYLIGTCDLHEILAIAEVLHNNSTLIIPSNASPNYLQHNRKFFERFLDIFYSI